MSKGTRILNISPKAQLAIDDCAQGSYPTILRTGDDRTLGNDPSVFVDTGTQVYVKQQVLMPYNVSKTQAALSSFLTGSITIEKIPTPASQFLTTFEDSSWIPYDESRNPAAFFVSGSEDNAGYPFEKYQGFTAEVSSQICIPIDISLSQNQDISLTFDTKGTKTSTSPFVYFNFDDRKWDQIGITDTASGVGNQYLHALEGTTTVIDGITCLDATAGMQKVVKQFTSSPGIGSEISGIGGGSAVGYKKIGYPTSFFQAPNAPRYHGKNSQTLKLKNVIQHPFILEKVVVEIPIKGTRKQGAVGQSGAAQGFSRDIDNHVFFIYRQNRTNASIDSKTDISSSLRALVANESFCFYNLESMPFVVQYQKPTHPNQLSYNYGMTSADTSTSETSPLINLQMQFRPKIYDEQFAAASTMGFLKDRGTLNEAYTTCYQQNFWSGGTMTEIYNEAYLQNICDPGIRTIQQIPDGLVPSGSIINYKFPIDERTLISATWNSLEKDIVRNLQYFDKPVGVTAREVTSDQDGYRENPYILFPEDELIFGIDAGFFPTFSNAIGAPGDLPDGYDDSINTSTIGNLRILAGKSKVTLYGTLIKDNQQLMTALNQKLTSNALHEDVHEIVTDEFQIHQNLIYSSSYVDNYITGSIFSLTSPRGLVSRATSNKTYPDMCLNRYVTLTNFTAVLSNSVGGILSGINSSRLTTKYPTVNFRYDKFGQFRDMLEQRRDSKYTEDVVIVPNFPLLTFDKVFGKSYISSPVLVTFTSKSSDIPARPIDTTSCNLSSECTSSLPYFDDGSPRNRTPIVFTKNPSFSVETIILDKPSSLLSST